jgi:hypothetical protein
LPTFFAVYLNFSTHVIWTSLILCLWVNRLENKIKFNLLKIFLGFWVKLRTKSWEEHHTFLFFFAVFFLCHFLFRNFRFQLFRWFSTWFQNFWFLGICMMDLWNIIEIPTSKFWVILKI